MAYLIKLGEQARERPEKKTLLTGVGERRPLLASLLAVLLLASGAVVYQALPHSAVIAKEDPNSAQEVADDGGGSNAIAVNGEVADDSQFSRSAVSR